jgi:hypothetical protein
MHATYLVGINDITLVLLVYTCQQGVYPRDHVPRLRLPHLADSVVITMVVIVVPAKLYFLSLHDY